MSRQRVVSIHGLNTKGDWQENVSSGLEPHFSYDIPKYSFFRWFGFSKVAAGIGPLSILLYLLCLFAVWLLGELTWTRALGGGVAVLLLFSFARFMRESTVDKIAQALRRHQDELPPHVVAHSLGSYLLIRALRKNPSLKVQNIVLVGSVVNPAFDWENLRTRFEFVRNEVGMHDPVGRITPLVGFMNGDFGASGRAGFRQGAAHRLPSAEQNCPDCRRNVHYDRLSLGGRPSCQVCLPSDPQCSARVHDVVFDEFGHSDALTGLNAEPYWVPFFWNINPQKFERFNNLCLQCEQAFKDGDTAGLVALERRLLSECWGWTASSLADRLHWELRQRKASLTEKQRSDWIDVMIRQLWKEYLKGIMETRKPKAEIDPQITRLAYPPVAMWRVLGAANL